MIKNYKEDLGADWLEEQNNNVTSENVKLQAENSKLKDELFVKKAVILFLACTTLAALNQWGKAAGFW